MAFGASFSSAAAGAPWPIANHCPSLGPPPSIGGGAHRPLTAPASSLSLLGPILSCLPPFPFPWPFPPSAVVPIGLSQPLRPPSPSLALSFPVYLPFLSLGLSLQRLWCPSASLWGGGGGNAAGPHLTRKTTKHNSTRQTGTAAVKCPKGTHNRRPPATTTSRF